MKNNKLKYLASGAFITLCSVSFALAKGLTDINSVTKKFTDLGNTFIQVLIGFAIIWIIVSVVRYLIMGAEDSAKRASAGNAILWGVIGLFVIVSIWGIVRIFTNTFNFDNNSAPVESFPKADFKK